MSDKPSVIEALTRVMSEVQAVRKGDRNTQQGYVFRGIDAVVNAVGPVIRKHGVVIVPHHSEAHYRDVQTNTGKPSRECTVLVTYRAYGPAGDHIEITVPGESMDFGDKGAPKAMSVAYRIALLQALCIPTDEPDPDSQSYERVAPARPQHGPTDAKWLDGFAGRVEKAPDLAILRGLWGELKSEYEAGHVEETHRDSLLTLLDARKADLTAEAGGPS